MIALATIIASAPALIMNLACSGLLIPNPTATGSEEPMVLLVFLI